jgi:flavodoxin I
MVAKAALVLAVVALHYNMTGLSFAAPMTPARLSEQSPMAVAAPSLSWAPASADSTPLGSTAMLFGLAAAGGVAVALAQRRARTACEAVGLLYATQTGNTETVAGYIAEAAGVEAADVGDYGAEDLAEFDGLIVGCPTWNTGADEYRSGTAWDDLLDGIKEVDLKGKPVAVFGCGDSQAYGDNFCDGIEELHGAFQAAGAKMVGYVPSSGYQHSESKSDQGGKFLGCPFDEDNESDQSEDRAAAWIEQIKGEGMPL